MADKLRAAVNAYGDVNPETAEGRLVAQMGDFIQVLQASYTQALVDAGDNYRANESKKIPPGRVVVYWNRREAIKNTKHPATRLCLGALSCREARTVHM